MKNFTRLFGVITLVAVILFSMAACNDGSSGTNTLDNKPKNPIDDSPIYGSKNVYTVGRLAITGLQEYDGLNVFVFQVENNNNIVLCASDNDFLNGTTNGVEDRISSRETSVTVINGQAVLAVCLLTSSRGYQNYNGNDLNVKFKVLVRFVRADNRHETENKGTVTVNFVNGVSTPAGVFVPN